MNIATDDIFCCLCYIVLSTGMCSVYFIGEGFTPTCAIYHDCLDDVRADVCMATLDLIVSNTPGPIKEHDFGVERYLQQ